MCLCVCVSRSDCCRCTGHENLPDFCWALFFPVPLGLLSSKRGWCPPLSLQEADGSRADCLPSLQHSCPSRTLDWVGHRLAFMKLSFPTADVKASTTPAPCPLNPWSLLSSGIK